MLQLPQRLRPEAKSNVNASYFFDELEGRRDSNLRALPCMGGTQAAEGAESADYARQSPSAGLTGTPGVFFRRYLQRRNLKCRVRPSARFSDPSLDYRFWPAIFCAVNNKTFRSFSFVLLSSRRN
jgi:hypothetical protein